jgi:hypothetical protein
MQTLASRMGIPSVGSPQILSAPQILGDPVAMVENVTQADRITKYVEGGYVAADRIDVAIGPLTNLGIGATAILTGKVVDPFKPELMFFPSTLAPGVHINQVTIGSTNMVDGNTSGIPAEKYSEVSQQCRVSYPTVPVSVEIQVRITNNSGAPINNVAMAANGIRLRPG